MGLAGAHTMFLQRSSVDEPFTTVQHVTTAPPENVESPYMTDNCGQLYFTALRTVFYQQQ